MARRVSKKKDEARQLAVLSARIAHEDNCQDIVILDLRGISQVTQYFVIATGSSDRQMRAVADDICHQASQIGQNIWHVAGKESAQWIVLDFVDVVVHIFDHARRRYYDLELIWGEAPRPRWRRPAKAKPMRPAGRE